MERTAGPGPLKALVMGTDARSFLGVLRSLGRRGIEVHGTWCEPDAFARRSRYVASWHELPVAEAEDGPWADALDALCREEAFDLVIPTHDPSVVALQAQRERFARCARVYQLNPRAFEVAYDKRRTSELARELGVPVPDERVLRPGESVDAGKLIAELGAPLVLKPRRSFAFGRLKWEHQVRKARDAREVETSLDALLEAGEVLAQRNVPGRGVGVEVLAVAGDLRLAFQHARLHEPLHGGGSSYRRSERLDPELLAAVESLCRATDYDGVGMFEFKRDDATGRWWLIEINGRFWGSLPLALRAGADFPWALFQHGTTGRVEPQLPYRVGVTCRNLSIDWPWLWRNLRADHGDEELATVPLRRLLGEGLRAATLRDPIDAFALDDRAPGWAELRAVGSELARLTRKKMSRLPYRVAPLRALLTSGLRRDLARAARILFVCKGNICRSPFAEHYARRVLPRDVELSSSGTYPVPDRSSPAEAVEAARSFGVDLSRHRSHVLDERTAEAADLILAFDESNVARLRELFPAVAPRVFRLGALAPRGSVDLADPYGGALGAYEASYAEIAASLDAVAELLARPAREARPSPEALEEGGA